MRCAWGEIENIAGEISHILPPLTHRNFRCTLPGVNWAYGKQCCCVKCPHMVVCCLFIKQECRKLEKMSKISQTPTVTLHWNCLFFPLPNFKGIFLKFKRTDWPTRLTTLRSAWTSHARTPSSASRLWLWGWWPTNWKMPTTATTSTSKTQVSSDTFPYVPLTYSVVPLP